ncbi:hypothetical protein H8L32_01210 [Undibacterium sp. CY18W]|uniref:Uncharacterized protein n=1 Tax=Undibacterium hunanense TaxID=2762292 RepID=A0ABR6ZJQ3_9BURK|nr:hypothetical protein [Undibacterium hunanense]MBC3916091.1 hypothetical protein [Undibacterium hunanense]
MGLGNAFSQTLRNFSEEIFPIMEEWPDDFPKMFKEKVLDIVERGAAALITSNIEEAELIDEIVFEYWDLLHNEQNEYISSPIKHYNYPDELSEVLPNCSNPASDYYQMLLFEGRTVAACPDYSFKSPDGIFCLSWLYPHEIIELKTELDSFEGILNGDEDAVIAVNLLVCALTEAAQSRCSLLVTIG